MIQSFADAETEKLFNHRKSRRLPANVHRVALRKLAQLNAVYELNQLAVPPGNSLEALKKDRAGQHSIRINDQWRLCFVWRGQHPYDVEIGDYH